MRRWLGVVGVIGALVLVAVPSSQARRRDVDSAGGAAVAPSGTAASPYRSAILIDADTGTVLFEQDSHLAAPPASMTKLMLMLLVAERVRSGQAHWNDSIPTSRRASQMGGSQVYLKEGEVFLLSEMMQAIVIHSANDAAAAVAEALAGSTAAFVDLMNERAQQLGMKDTKYRSVHGLPPDKGEPPDLSSSFDTALLARQVVMFSDILKWTSTKEAPFRNGALTLTNTNRLVRETNWVDGLKTGYYREAGFNVTATGQRDGLRLIAVVMGAAQKQDCFAAAARLLNKGFADYRALSAVKAGDTIASDVPVKGGKPRFVRVVAGSSLNVLAKRGERRNFAMQLELASDLQAPLSAQAIVGQVIVRDGDAVVGKVPALAADPVERQTSLWDRMF